jgi:DNA-binding transcriptional MerR regulator
VVVIRGNFMVSIKDSKKVGATIKFDARGFEQVEHLLAATGGLSLSQVCSITGIEATTIQNWVKRGWVEHPDGKKYGETHIARILIINSLKECIKLEHISLLMEYIKGKQKSTNVVGLIKESDVFTCLCRALSEIGNVNAMARGGVESVAERAVSDLKGITLAVKDRVKKALTVMIYACVCTDVKRRTESMLEQVLNESGVAPDDTLRESDKSKIPMQTKLPKQEKQPIVPKNVMQPTRPEQSIQPVQAQTARTEQEPEAVVARKTISQALRELEMNLAEDKRESAQRTATEVGADEIFSEIEPQLPQEEQDDSDSAKTEPTTIKPIYFKRN